jgi:hypothetical protein
MIIKGGNGVLSDWEMCKRMGVDEERWIPDGRTHCMSYCIFAVLAFQLPGYPRGRGNLIRVLTWGALRYTPHDMAA